LSLSVASAAAVGVGLAWGTQLTGVPVTNPAPSATTAVTLVSSTYSGNRQPSCTAYNAATVSAAATGFLPLVSTPTTALTALPIANLWIPLDGVIVLPSGGWVALAASATATTSQFQYGIVWAESTK
jgi:hypothetical protein